MNDIDAKVRFNKRNYSFGLRTDKQNICHLRLVYFVCDFKCDFHFAECFTLNLEFALTEIAQSADCGMNGRWSEWNIELGTRAPTTIARAIKLCDTQIMRKTRRQIDQLRIRCCTRIVGDALRWSVIERGQIHFHIQRYCAPVCIVHAACEWNASSKAPFALQLAKMQMHESAVVCCGRADRWYAEYMSPVIVIKYQLDTCNK